MKRQLKVGGRLVIPIGADQRAQELVRVTRSADGKFKTEDIADVRFVPLVGQEGWLPEESPFLQREGPTRARPVDGELARAIGEIWFDKSSAVTPLGTKELEGLPDTYPFGL